ncbi:hypothetical protein E8E12_007105 [Didymella heteroderae]|uniref:Uncharacterized protein n=1 Tax=Didymella heteroderae TaxID=1769908 RepID=A0A9P4WQG3_9PLEO|nr:hypothetical protein E8E12_007105 [Didymella heteroderae]
MPSFLKKLLLGKELSNPYVNKYHPGHRATPQPAQHVPNYAAEAMDPHPTSLTLSTRIPSRPVSPTYLEEARRLAGRDPVTGRALSTEQYLSFGEGSAQARQTGRGQQQSHTNERMRRDPYVASGHAAVNGDRSRPVQGRVEQQTRTVGIDVQQERHDVTVRDERRRRLEEESAAAERLRQQEVGGYFAPERSVREYYGGP